MFEKSQAVFSISLLSQIHKSGKIVLDIPLCKNVGPVSVTWQQVGFLTWDPFHKIVC